MPDSLTSMMEEDASDKVGVPIPTDADFASVSELVNQQLVLEVEVINTEENLKDLKKKLAEISRGQLPAALQKFNLTEFKLTDDSVVTIKEEIHAGISDENRDAAMRWLEETGHDDIIKNAVSLSFGKGQDGEVRQLLDTLNAKGYSYENKRGVHPMTLKAFVKRQLEDGENIPLETFSVFVEKVAKIKLPRRRS